MVIEEIINELDKFITKYKERKSSEEKGISLRNNIKQALTEKGVQGAEALDDSAIVERIKTLSSSGNTTVEGTQGNNSINESYAQQVVELLKENHIPFLNSTEDNIEELKKWTQKVNALIGNKKIFPDIKYVDGKTIVKVKPVEYFGVKVDCVCDSGAIDETIKTEKEYTGVTSMSIQPVDYYGAKDRKLGKQTLNFEFLEKMKSLDKLQVKLSNGWGSTIMFDEITDGNDYNIFDERMKSLYLSLLEKKAKTVDSTKTYIDNTSIDGVKKYKLTGNIKLLVLNKEGKGGSYDGINFLGMSYLYDGIDLATKPKYIAVVGSNSINGFSGKINRENRYEDREYTHEWDERAEKVKESKTVIYRWDSTKNKYMFESAETLEEWLKTHPIETL